MTTTAGSNGSVEEATLNFLHTIGDQGSVQETRLKNEMIDVMAAEQQPHLREALMDVILRTTNKEVLEALATAPKACRIYHEWIKEALKETDWLTIGKMLKVLDHLPLETSTLVEYKLGKAVNIVQKKAVSHDKVEMSSEARQVMNKWNEQHKTAKSTTTANGDLNTEKRKAPPTSATNPNKKAPRLAISDERPVKPKPQAKTDMNFFKMFNSNNNNNGTRKLPPTGLRREESFILEASDSSNSPTPSSPQSLLSPTGSISSFASASSLGIPVPSLRTTNINGAVTSLKSTDKTKRSGKRVVFNDESLVKVCYYSKHNWKISDKPHEVFDDEDDELDFEVQHSKNLNNSATFPHLKNQQQSKNLNNWHRAPARLLLSHECKHAGEVQSEEAILQRKREAVTPPVLYKNDYEIPYTPEEPDDFGSNNDEGNVKVIPLEDLACYDQEEDNNGGLIAVDHNHEQQQQQQRYHYNDHLNNGYSDTNNNNTPSAVPVSVPITTISSAPSTTNILPASLPNVDFPQLQALLNGVFSSSTSPSSIPSQPQSQSQHSLPPQSSYTSTYQQQQLATGRSSNYMNSRGENYEAFSAPSSSHHRGGG
ncbi:hypothetical protein INT45_004348 [Circinella minor]|uniref:TFIIS N-terminal domain-containing protein n=1 Tax=Circinella minor TaxID=1195481 RepID=A0A8H7VQA0_9FUNG|nr:hypothetical protein INT45_004348 [Circinella minor]